MYDDPRHLRNQEIKVRFDEDTMTAIASLARITRKQKAVLIRDLVLDEIKTRLQASRETQAIGRA